MAKLVYKFNGTQINKEKNLFNGRQNDDAFSIQICKCQLSMMSICI